MSGAPEGREVNRGVSGDRNEDLYLMTTHSVTTKGRA